MCEASRRWKDRAWKMAEREGWEVSEREERGALVAAAGPDREQVGGKDNPSMRRTKRSTYRYKVVWRWVRGREYELEGEYGKEKQDKSEGNER